jgi:predicted peptidase
LSKGAAVKFTTLILVTAGLAALAITAGTAGEKSAHGFVHKVYKDGDGEWKYVVFVPPSYKGDKEFPLILFLHGAGERGTDGEKQAKVGLGKAIRDKKEKFGFIAVFPQATQSWQARSPDAKRALAILDQVEKDYKVDRKRVYLTGLSMGGFGTWSLAAANPTRWAAIVPVCGGGNPKTAEKIKDIPCWIFHGDADKAVNVQKSRDMFDALKAAGSSARYTEYPGVGHNSWDRAYGTAELFDWMGKQHLK